MIHTYINGSYIKYSQKTTTQWKCVCARTKMKLLQYQSDRNHTHSRVYVSRAMSENIGRTATHTSTWHQRLARPCRRLHSERQSTLKRSKRKRSAEKRTYLQVQAPMTRRNQKVPHRARQVQHSTLTQTEPKLCHPPHHRMQWVIQVLMR